MLTAAVLLVHLAAFATYLGAGFAQLQMMKASAKGGPAVDVRKRVRAPASGIVFTAQSPVLIERRLHGKLTCVLLLAVLSHLEMFNARAIVELHSEGNKAADEEIARRKSRHNVFGTIGTVLVVLVLVFVTFVRLG